MCEVQVTVKQVASAAPWTSVWATVQWGSLLYLASCLCHYDIDFGSWSYTAMQAMATRVDSAILIVIAATSLRHGCACSYRCMYRSLGVPSHRAGPMLCRVASVATG